MPNANYLAYVCHWPQNGEGTKDAGRAVDGGETDGGETEGRNQEESCCMNMLKEHCVKKFWCGDKDILKRSKCTIRHYYMYSNTQSPPSDSSTYQSHTEAILPYL
eukprot:GHVQ01025816.1.p4 GENE.GHVQ01025816.1~~GHVQ01025816.1.p4  ORF type:complete len:105 (-),score=19.65 GHVQ01025816.1:726-1040(-)